MSFLLALLLQTAAAQASVAEAGDQDIIVTASKLDRWKGKFSLRGERFKCQTTQTSGDKAIDPIGCAAIVECIEPHREQLRQSDDEALGVPARIAIKKAILDALGPCVRDTRKAMVAAFVARRRAAAQ